MSNQLVTQEPKSTLYPGFFPNAFTRMMSSDSGFLAITPIVLGLLTLLAIAAFDVSLSYTPLPSSPPPPPPVSPPPPLISPPPLKYTGGGGGDDGDDKGKNKGSSGSGSGSGEGTLLATRVLGSIMIFLTSAAFIALVVKSVSQKNTVGHLARDLDTSDSSAKAAFSVWKTVRSSSADISSACSICEVPPAQSSAVLLSYDLGGGCVAAIPPVMLALSVVAFMSSNTASLSGKGAAAVTGYVLNSIGFFIALAFGVAYIKSLSPPIPGNKSSAAT